MATIQAEIIKRSVTRDETEANAAGGGVFRFFVAGASGGGLRVSIPEQPPPYWSPSRDVALKSAYRNGGQWASAVNIAVTRVMSAGYKVGGDVALRVRRAREMIGASWIDLTTKAARDYVTTDNGCFWEVVRAAKGYGARVIGLVALSSLRCIRTGDPDIPVLYVDALGRYHELRSYQIAEFSDMPDEDFYGVGLSATSRAWGAIYEHMAVGTYFHEKATGRRPLSVYLVSGMSTELIDKGMRSAQEDATAKGVLSYMGATVIGNANPIPLTLNTIPLASLPDGFNQQQHEEMTQIRFANALGIDPSELNPRLIGNRALGAGSQAQVLDDKQNSKGLISLRQKILAFMNDTDRWHVLSGGVTFGWSERDLADQMQEAAIKQTRAATRAAQIASTEITAEEARQLAVDEGDLPETFIEIDTTDVETLTDEDKADGGDVAQIVKAPTEQETAPAPAPSPAPEKTKALDPFNAISAAFKAAYSTTLATLTMPTTRQSRDKEYWRMVTKNFDELGRIGTIAMRAEMPQDTGEMARSVRYAVTNKNTAAVTLKWFVGNKDRPEVAVRAVLFGRKGFGPKRRNGVLRFKIGDQIVFAKKVRGALANDWMSRAWDKIQPMIDDIESNAGSVTARLIDVSDIAGAIKRTRQSQIQAPKTPRGKRK
jgi:hypothetical protein